MLASATARINGVGLEIVAPSLRAWPTPPGRLRRVYAYRNVPRRATSKEAQRRPLA